MEGDEFGVLQIPLNIPASVLEQDVEPDSDEDDPVLKQMAACLLEMSGKVESSQGDTASYIVLPKKEHEIVLSSQLNSGITDNDSYLTKSENLVVQTETITGSGVWWVSGAEPVDLNLIPDRSSLEFEFCGMM